MALHDMNDDVLPLSSLFLHIQFNDKLEPESRRQSIDPIQEVMEDELDEFSMPAIANLDKQRKSVVSRFSTKLQKIAGLRDFRRSKEDSK